MSEEISTEWLNDRSDFQMNFIHGRANPIGLHLQYTLDGGVISTVWTPTDQHVGFPGHAHGGLTSAVLDDTMGRLSVLYGDWTVTARIEVRYRLPVLVGIAYRVEASVERRTSRGLTARGSMSNGTEVVATAKALYVSLPERVRDNSIQAWPEFARYLDGHRG